MNRTINEWIELVHGVAVEKGWWEPLDLSATSIQAKLMLAVSEVSEAVELVRLPDFDAKATWCIVGGTRFNYEAHLKATKGALPKPEGFGTEVADAIIRILDLAGALSIDDEEAGVELEMYAGQMVGKLASADAILAALMRAMAPLSAASGIVDQQVADGKRAVLDAGDQERPSFAAALFGAVHQLTMVCGALGVDVEAKISEKHEYNKTRSFRHGNKSA
jgi:hypothetical protein